MADVEGAFVEAWEGDVTGLAAAQGGGVHCADEGEGLERKVKRWTEVSVEADEGGMRPVQKDESDSSENWG